MKGITTISAVVGLFLAGTATAYRDSSPILVWSKSARESLRDAQAVISSGIIGAEEVYRTLPTLGCEWQKIAIVHVDQLHHSSVPALRLASSTADLHIPYLINPTRSALDSALQEWASVCGAEVVGEDAADASGKTIVTYKADDSESVIGEDGELRLASGDLSTADIIILTGTRSPSSQKRQEPNHPQRPNPTRTATSTSSATRTPTSTSTRRPTHPSNGTFPTDGPLLDRVQLLTTPIITALLISFGIFIPIIVFGVSALAGIQVPPRMMEIGKGMVVGKEKKDQ